MLKFVVLSVTLCYMLNIDVLSVIILNVILIVIMLNVVEGDAMYFSFLELGNSQNRPIVTSPPPGNPYLKGKALYS
jgi:hypothetical protein